jgi:uncharacterized membrane protein YkgB
MMTKLEPIYRAIDHHLTQWMAQYGVLLLRFSLGLVFFWFGVLKFFPGVSPAEDLALRTIDVLTFGLVPAALARPVLAAWEVLIGIGLMSGLALRATLLLLFLQMIGTVSPLFIFPQETFSHFPLVPTLEGQYILKNMVIVSAALVIGATVRGGRVVADPQALREVRPA